MEKKAPDIAIQILSLQSFPEHLELVLDWGNGYLRMSLFPSSRLGQRLMDTLVQLESNTALKVSRFRTTMNSCDTPMENHSLTIVESSNSAVQQEPGICSRESISSESTSQTAYSMVRGF